MNAKQKICLWVGIAVIVLMGIFPPTPRGYYNITYFSGIRERPGPIGHKFHSGYTFLFTAEASDIALNKLIIQWGIVGAVTFGLIYTFGDKKPKEEQKQ